MSNHHPIVCPFFQTDIQSKQRTLIHLPVDERDEIHVGDQLVLVPHKNFPRGAAAVVTEMSLVRLAELSDADLGKLGGPAREEYFQRWAAAYPDEPLDCEVWRIEFRYGFADAC